MHFRSSLTNTGILADTPSSEKKTNYNRVLRRPSPPLHLAGGVLLGRAYRGYNREAHDRVGFESYLPRSVFGWMMTGIGLVVIHGGGDVRIVGGVREEELGEDERRTHEHRESVRKLLG